MPDASITCPKCSAVAAPSDRFCGECGAALTASRAAERAPPRAAALSCPRCGPEGEIDETGFCAVCGSRARAPRAPDPRDHVEIVVSPLLAGVSDRGRKHARNEDDVAVAAATPAGGGMAGILVVADGASHSQNPQTASRLAANAAARALASAPATEAAMREAILAAHRAVLSIPTEPGEVDPAASTIVAALVCADGAALIGWVGDSRAYALGPRGVRQLSHDHSWLAEVVDAGQMTYAQALKDEKAHGITRWLGRQLDGSEPEIAVTSVALAPDEGVLACSDGLWNYAPDSAEIARILSGLPARATAIEICRALVAFANQSGGSDNVTAAILLPAGSVTDAGAVAGGGISAAAPVA
jgi:PPM family protein phosphatase